ncbi:MULTISPECIES: hypothetical protein [Nocardia]|uniref:hypothetical protein n=1 Tax=Nocardia TaxID=1817 RepID=UPI001894A975|nr:MULTISPECIES: hypothetical protein [Nocardia]MBF6351364.1 hypothetical protein [Nocardia flavorosea]
MTQTQVVKVFTPIKRVPIVIGKAQNGQKLPFGPYTLPQVAGVAVALLISAVAAMTLPANPAITFLVGLAFTVVIGFGLGLIPYTGVRLTSRVFWVGRLIFDPKPVSASGMPVTAESGRLTSFIEETVVVILPESASAARAAPSADPMATPFQQLFERRRVSDRDEQPGSSSSGRVLAPAAPASSNWRSMTTGNGVKVKSIRERATNGARG